MAENKKYYWLKLKSDFFDNLRMKKLRTIAGGDTYTIIYLKMQLLSLQDDGFLYFEGVEESFEQEIALIINENVEDVKLTIAFLVANNLLQEVEKGKYELIETRTCIGSETEKAELMRKLREKKNSEKLQDGNNVTNLLPNVTKCYTEKEKEIELELELEKRNKKEKKFIVPTIEEIKAYCLERQNSIDYQRFYDFYESKGWMVGKNKMKDWKACVRTWENNTKIAEQKNQIKSGNPFFDILREEGKMWKEMKL